MRAKRQEFVKKREPPPTHLEGCTARGHRSSIHAVASASASGGTARPSHGGLPATGPRWWRCPRPVPLHGGSRSERRAIASASRMPPTDLSTPPNVDESAGRNQTIAVGGWSIKAEVVHNP